MTPRLRVLAVLPAAAVGGAEAYLLTLLGATDRLDVTVVALTEGAAAEAFRAAGMPVTVLPTGRRAVDGLRPALQLAALLRRERPDVLLANGVKAAALALPVARMVGVPCVWVKHDRSFDTRLARPLGRLADRVAAADPSMAPPVGRDDVEIIVPPAPPPAISRAEAREVLGIDPGARVLGVMTRLVDYKGVDDALLAVAQVPGWTLVVVGEDDPAAPGERARLERMAVEHGAVDRVHFAGAHPGASRLVSAFDVAAVLTKHTGPGSPTMEGFGTSAMEAARAGVPVIATAGSPPAERYGTGAGAAVPGGRPDAVAEVLRELLDDDELARRGARALELSADHPTPEQCAAQLVQVCAEAAGRSGAGLEAPPVSVVVTVYDEESAVPGLLARLLPQLRADDELVVVDGGSTDGTAELLQEASLTDPRLTVHVEPGAGISAGRNTGIRLAEHEHIACTDAGCEPVAGWLAALTAPFSEARPPGLVTGTYTATGDRLWARALALVAYPDPREARCRTPFVRAYGALLGRRYDAALPTGRSVAFTRSAWKAGGGFPEHLQTGEDVSFGQAVVAEGVPVVLALDAEVAWAQRATLRANLRMFRAYGHGDGLSGHRLLVGRNLARAVAYPLGLALLSSGRPGRRVALAGGAAYLSLPLARAAREEPAALPLVPVMAALRDGAKAWGCVQGLLARRRP